MRKLLDTAFKRIEKRTPKSETHCMSTSKLPDETRYAKPPSNYEQSKFHWPNPQTASANGVTAGSRRLLSDAFQFPNHQYFIGNVCKLLRSVFPVRQGQTLELVVETSWTFQTINISLETCANCCIKSSR